MSAQRQAAWFDDARTRDPEQVCGALGLQVRHGRRLEMQCPACGEVQRSSSSPDRRLAAEVRGVRDGAARWRCWRCDAYGDVIDMVAHRLAGGPFRGQAQVREWFGGATVAEVQAQEYTPPPAEYPPVDEVAELWRRCPPAEEDAEVADWMRRRLGPRWLRVGRYGRALPRCGGVPPWARSWARTGHRAVFPVWDATGQMRSLRARRVREGEGPKCLPPMPHGERHYAAGGLVLACPVALRLLRGQPMPDGWPAVVPLVVTEGEPAWLAWAAGRRHAVMGVTSGSWSLPIASRVPDGTPVLVATDHNAAGHRYAAAISDSLSARCPVTRWAPAPDR